MEVLDQIETALRRGDYVDVDISLADGVIRATQGLGNDWDTFLKNAPEAVLHSSFEPCINSMQLRRYILEDLAQDTGNKDDSLADRISKLFESASIYLQKYEINVEGTKGKVMIWRTPSSRDFDRARVAILYALECLQQIANGAAIIASSPNPEVTMHIRGLEKFFDIDIESGINEEAWIAFDFR